MIQVRGRENIAIHKRINSIVQSGILYKAGISLLSAVIFKTDAAGFFKVQQLLSKTLVNFMVLFHSGLQAEFLHGKFSYSLRILA